MLTILVRMKILTDALASVASVWIRPCTMYQFGIMKHSNHLVDLGLFYTSNFGRVECN
jgi:hypothetical protein